MLTKPKVSQIAQTSPLSTSLKEFNTDLQKRVTSLNHLSEDFFAQFLYVKDLPLDGDGSSVVCVIDRRPGSFPHCCPSNRIKSNSEIQKGILRATR